MTSGRPRGTRGTGSPRLRADGTYGFRYYNATGRQVTAPLAFQTKTAARAWYRDMLAKQAGGVWTDPAASELLRTFGERELSLKTYTPLSRAQAQWLWTKFVEPAFGDWTLRKITLTDVQEWRSGL